MGLFFRDLSYNRSFVEESIESKVSDFFELLKPRVMSLVVFTASIGIFRAPGEIHPFLFFLSLLSIATASGASGVLNMWYERYLDACMLRTATRPLPSGRIKSNEALVFGVLLSLGSVILMGLSLNWFAACLLLFTILFYVVVYTVWLKPRTDQNIVIGGVAGALPPVIGWVSVTGNVSLEPCFLFLLIFFWTPPHFWSLAMVCGDDYKKIKLPMLPHTKGRCHASFQGLFYTILVFIISTSLYCFSFVGLFYLFCIIVLGLIFMWKSFVLFISPFSDDKAWSLFGFSIIYLFSIFIILGLDKIF